MGGLGSGRWPEESRRKETTEDYFALDIRQVKRFGLIAPNQEKIPGVARIEWIPAGFGGGAAGGFERPWFLCPRCQKRVAILYGKQPGVPPWACRKCRNLCYPVELEDRAGRAMRKMSKARARLGPGDKKPKRMRHKTFVRLGIKYLEAVREANEALHEQNVRLFEQMQAEEERYDL